MNIAIIFAGGTGQRMNTKTVPKQFLELHGKPIIVYTIEKFQNHKEIDGIIIVCLEDWVDHCKELVVKYALNKVVNVVPGGSTGQMSIFNGLDEAMRHYEEDSVVLVHDGVRPLIDADTIHNAIKTVKQYGSAITVCPAKETISLLDSNLDNEIGTIIDRKKCFVAKAPQCFPLKDLYMKHLEAQKEECRDYIDSASLMRNYGYPLYYVLGKEENIKITTPVDFYTFKAILDAQENSQIFGIN